LAAAALVLQTPRGQAALEQFFKKSYLATGFLVARASNPVCSWWQATRGLQEALMTAEKSRLLAAQARHIRDDEHGHQLWQTSLVTWWFPAGSSEESVRFALAQYELGAYPDLEVHPGDVVLDCGGFIGDWAYWALRAGAARVIIAEPAEAQGECIRRNLAEPIRQGRAVLIPKGVWDRDDKLVLSHWEDNPAGNSVAVQRGPRGETIELTTIDAIVEQLGLQRLDVIKMDIEGAETRALRGAVKTLNRFRPRLAVATEHTADRIRNNREVIAAVQQAAPFYSVRCGYCVLKNGRTVIPETLYFFPR
jgi:FkbM family methyltransferase